MKLDKFVGKKLVALGAMLSLTAIVMAIPANARVARHSVESNDVIETAVAAGQFKTLAAALEAAELIEALKGNGPFTVFAPTDEAFAKLPAGTVETLLKPENKEKLKAVLLYHVVPGNVTAEQVTKLNGRSVKTLQGSSHQSKNVAWSASGQCERNADRHQGLEWCDSRNRHCVDAKDVRPTEGEFMRRKTDIVETALAANNFSTLAAALDAAGLIEILKGEGPFTVFAPTDAAFAKVPKQTLNELLQPENRKKLAAILAYHVVPGKVTSHEVIANDSATTLLGQKLNISKQDGVKINEAKVIVTDIRATNGVIHVIDSVLMPA